MFKMILENIYLPVEEPLRNIEKSEAKTQTGLSVEIKIILDL